MDEGAREDLLSAPGTGPADRGVLLAEEPELLCQGVHGLLQGNPDAAVTVASGVPDRDAADAGRFPWRSGDSAGRPLSGETGTGFTWLVRRLRQDANRHG